MNFSNAQIPDSLGDSIGRKKLAVVFYINRILNDTLYRSSFLRLLLRSIVSDNCMIVSCDEKLSKIVAGVNSQKKLRESRYRSKSVDFIITTANFRSLYYESGIVRFRESNLITTNPNLGFASYLAIM